MALRHDFPATSKIFAGEDKTIEFTIFDSDGVTPLDVAAWTFEWVLRAVYPRRLTTPARIPPEAAVASVAPDPVLRKDSDDGIAVTGVFNADPDLNTQRVVVTIADTDTEGIAAGTYNHALKRLDDGFETILSFGEFVLRKAAVV